MSVLPKLNSLSRWKDLFGQELTRTFTQNLSPRESPGSGWDGADTSSYPDAIRTAPTLELGKEGGLAYQRGLADVLSCEIDHQGHNSA